MKITTNQYDRLEGLNKQNKKAWIIIGGIVIIISIFIIVMAVLLYRESLLNQIKECQSYGENEMDYSGIALVSIIFLIFYIVLKEVWFKLIFYTKKLILNDYYDRIESKIDSIPNNDKECNLIFVPKTSNGMLIGALESLLFTFAILIRSFTLLGFILAIRSYVSVNSHPNKEESEFYIIGLMGSLIYSIIMTTLYILTLRSIFGFDIMNAAMNYFHFKI